MNIINTLQLILLGTVTVVNCEKDQWASIYDQFQNVGGQVYQNVNENLEEAKDIAKVLAVDAKDAVKTVNANVIIKII